MLLIVLTQCVPRVPNVVGLSERQASARLMSAGYQVGTVSRALMPKTPVGQVAEQYPAADAIFARGRSVDLVVALGADVVKVPNVIGLDTPAAELLLSAKDLVMQASGQYSATIPAGAVMSQDPTAGTKVRVEIPGSGGRFRSASNPSWVRAANRRRGPEARHSGGSSTSADDAPGSNCTASYPNAEVWASGGDIYIRLTPGSGSRRLTSGSAWDSGPILAPSAKYVVFMRAPSSGQESQRCRSGLSDELRRHDAQDAGNASALTADGDLWLAQVRAEPHGNSSG